MDRPYPTKLASFRTCALRAAFLTAAAGWLSVCAAGARGQTDDPKWRGPRDAAAASPETPAAGAVSGGAASPLKPLDAAPDARVAERDTIARVTKGSGVLPNDHGQIWREYDIRPYTLRVTTTKRPEHAIVDWILRETGWEAWHSETVAVLSADNGTLRVYHTPEMQQLVSEVIDRFVNSKAASHAFNLHIVTIGNPNWRASAMRVLKPIPVQSQGIQAWLLAKEDAAILRAQLSRRSDYREYTSPQLLVHNGQSTVVASTRAVRYAKSVLDTPGVLPGYRVETGVLDVGYSLEFSPLLTLDEKMLDAVVKCNIDQVEKMIPVNIDLPAGTSPNRMRIEVPQMTSCKLHERFRWPADQVLLVSRGVVATPGPAGGNALAKALPILPKTPDRADALLFIESKGEVKAPPEARAAVVPTVRGR